MESNMKAIFMNLGFIFAADQTFVSPPVAPEPDKLNSQMHRRRFLALSGSALMRAAAARPNILFLMADQFRADALGASGNTWVRTPSLDRLAAGGVRFSNAYTPQALCTPARASLMTGVYPHTTRVPGNLYKVKDAFQEPNYRLTPNLPTLLRQAGYHTGYIGKWHLGEVNPGFFDYWNGYSSYDALNPKYPLQPHWMGKPYESAYRSDVDTDDAVRFLEENRSRPFALFVSYYPPHNPYNPPRKFEEMYQNREHAGYYGAVTAVDLDVGRVLDKLAALKLDDSTFVSFTADHGETFAQRPGSQAKTVCYEESAKVPLLLRWPGKLPAAVYQGGMTTLDLMPMILEAAGVATPDRCQGQSRLGDVRAGRLGWKEPVFLQNITQYPIEGKPAIERAVRTERWKLILRDHPRSELYDIEADPGERNDLFAREPGRVKELAALIANWGARVGDTVAAEMAAKYA
jgi:arylsulfatase A-like enzyme